MKHIDRTPTNRLSNRDVNPQVLASGRVATALTCDQKAYEKAFFLATVLDQSLAATLGSIIEQYVDEVLKANGLTKAEAKPTDKAARLAALTAEIEVAKTKFIESGEFHYAERIKELRAEQKKLLRVAGAGIAPCPDVEEPKQFKTDV
jgi:citrate lyase gamma subunit